MATIHWTGKADAVSQVIQVTPGGTIGTETFTLTVSNVNVTYTAESGDTGTNVSQALRDAWNNTTHPYFAAVTATEQSGVLILTADIPGVPFSVEANATGSATLVGNTTTNNAGPNAWSTPGNWSTNTVPADGDHIVIANSSDALLWGLDQSGITLQELVIEQNFTGFIGLPESSFTLSAADVDDSKPEYRDTYLKIGASNIRIGEHHGNSSPTGASRIKINTEGVQTQLNIINTSASSADANMEPVRWVGTHEDNVIHITKGLLGIATTQSDEVATVATLNIGQRGNAAGDATVHIADGVTVGTINQAAGNVTIGADLTMLNQSAGVVTTYANASITSAVIGGTAYLNGAGTISTLRVRGGGSVDFSRDPRAKVVTDCYLYRGASLNLNNGNPLSITMTNDIQFIQCEPADTVLATGPDIRVALSSI